LKLGAGTSPANVATDVQPAAVSDAKPVSEDVQPPVGANMCYIEIK